MITDDECGVSEEWMRGWNEAKHQLGYRAFGVAIGEPRRPGPGRSWTRCATTSATSMTSPTHAVADLFRLI